MVGIGELLASAVVKEVCSKLAATVGKEVALQLNTAADLESMQGTLSSIQAVLVDAERRSLKEESVRLWLKKLKAAAYDIEDMLVDYEAIVPSHEAEILDGTVQKGKGWIDLLKLRYLKSRLNIPHRMKMMRERLEKIKEEADISKFHFKYGSSSGEEEVTRSRQTTSNACEDIVGRVEEKKWLMRLLLLADEPSIIPIYGLGGIGKTTLAQMVYNDKGIEKNFDLLSWVYVSKKFDLEMIGRSIISKSKESSQNDIDLELVTHHAKSSISDKKFLIVLDDLWEEDPFKLEELKTMLKGGKKGSKIIVTTRSEKVAKLINSNLQFKLDGLPDNDCWTLFKSKAFKNSTMEVNLQNMGKEIVKKCNGVPLAAKSIGFLLRDKEVTAWEAVRDSDIWEERDDGPLAEKKVLPSLKLSYYHMPSYLRLCFAYCAVFPKGSDIDKHSLINQWIALGFIQATQGNLKEEDYAEQYLKDLLEMSFLQIARICSIAERYSKPTRVLLMHDLVHDLARSIAGDEIFVVNGVNKSSRDTAISYCRYALVTNYGDPSKSCKDDLPSTARALHFRGCSKMILPRNMFASTKFLRVLDLSGCSTRDLPSSCSQLKQLKYLNCSGLQIQRLPSSMSALQNLQVLNLSYCASLDMLPTWIGSFPILRHLNLHGCSSLSELPECIGRLRNLRYLDVSACSRLQMLPISFGELENLSSLNLSGCADLQILPQSFFFLRNLTDLNLSSCCRLEQLPPLSPRHHEVHDILNALDICDSACPEKLPEFDGDLMKLERLDLANCINLREIPESYGTLSRLRFLNLSGCFKLKNILRFFANSHYTNLEYLNLSNVHKINDFTTIDNFRQGDRFVDPIEDLARDRFVDPMEDLTPSLLHEQVESHMEDLANDIFVDPKKDLTLSLLREQVGSMVHLKYLSVGGVTLFSEQGLRSLVDLMTLPAFYVSSMTQSDGINISNIFILQQILDTSHHRLYIDGIENVESPLEARRAELAKHHQLQSLELRWSRGISGDCIGGGDADINVLEELCPHQNLVDLSVTGYRGSTFIGWMADISNSLPQLTKIKLSYLPRCGLLPPLGQLPNLREVDIAHIPGIKDVGFDFYGGTQPFQRLEVLRLSHMDNLEEWATTVLQEDVTFPKLKNLIIVSCAKLRFKPFIPRSDAYDITASDKVLSFERALGHSNPMVLSTMLITGLYFDGWRGLQYITNLQVLDIKYCRNLSYLPENIQSMRSLHTLVIEECPDFKALPENIGELTSLQKLTIVGSQLKCLPQSMQHLSALKMLRLIRCDSKLGEWFFYSDNQMAISHIPDIQLDMEAFLFVCTVRQQSTCGGSSRSSNIVDLQPFTGSFNRLSIYDLQNVIYPEEAKKSELQMKRMRELRLFWSTDHARTSAQDEAVLANLQPPAHLLRLHVQGYMGTRFTGWASTISYWLPYIVKITLSKMPRCMHLPPLGLLTNLRNLDISDIENLEEWSIMQVDDQEEDTDMNFRNLHTLCIRDCPKLRFKPSIPASLRYYIQNSSEVLSSFDRPSSQRKLFDRAAYRANSAFQSSAITMEIDGCKLSCDEWKGLECLRSLEKLTVQNCPTLVTLPESIQGLHSLQKLHIRGCRNFSTLPECLEHLSSLKELRIELSDMLLSFPQSMQRLSSLQTLNLWCDVGLEDRYRSGEHWSRIAHIPEININGRLVRRCRS